MEFMFSKMLKKRDTGKLGCLLVPRQEAEKYFPMGSGEINESGASFLTFEDSIGKIWHFHYSFWGSNKTYVLTKGWLSFVKEKKLYHGDIVSFYQPIGDAAGINHRFIFFKKQDHGSSVPHHMPPTTIAPFGTLDDNWLLKAFGSSSYYRASLAEKHLSYGSMATMLSNLSVVQPPLIHQGAPSGSGVGPAKKRVRLFGVDLNPDNN
jgi:hypothetical protein